MPRAARCAVARCSGVTLSAGSRPPEPAFADWPILISTASARAICSGDHPK